VIPDLTPLQIGVSWIVLCVAATLQGSIGFGLGVLGAPLLVLIAPGLVPGPLLVNALVITLLVVYRERRAVDLSGLGWAVGGRAVGVVAAAATLAVLPRDAISLAIGAAVLLVVVINAAGLRVRPGTKSLVVAGVLSGLTGTIASVGGPPMALLYQDAAGSRLRGTLSGYFVVGVIMSLTALAFVGRFGWGEFRAGLAMIPGTLAGYFVSGRAAAVADRGSFLRIAVLTVSAASGVVVIVRQLSIF
jgi:uncharacterized membrane protein YfcA